jgi:hypothetical protein
MEQLTIEEAHMEVAKIALIGNGDPEAAHGCEDDLLWRFVEMVAADASSAHSEVAQEICKSFVLDFPRYCA